MNELSFKALSGCWLYRHSTYDYDESYSGNNVKYETVFRNGKMVSQKIYNTDDKTVWREEFYDGDGKVIDYVQNDRNGNFVTDKKLDREIADKQRK